ncbi:MAG: hypothetical protein KA505_07015 [Xanthomonadales bacterium]|jgi:hypothetical protein|nr:hypothetical protein [Xanthomonadales bacterium]
MDAPDCPERAEDVVSTQRLEGPGFTIDLEDRAGFLRAIVHGAEDTLSVSTAYWARLGDECQRRGARAILVLEDLPAWPNAGPEIFEAVTDAMVAAGFRDIRCAFVDLHEEVEANEYGMIVGAEKGLTIMMFSNESYAERWLRFGSPQSPQRRGID